MGIEAGRIGLRVLAAVVLAFLFARLTAAQSPGRNLVSLRGQQAEIYYYPATGQRLNRKVLFAPGDGGWRGWAITIAQQMASWGYDVYGIDTKTYLESFTGKTTLSENDVMADFRNLALWMTRNSGERVTLVGWSEGAGLSVLAASSPENKRVFNGLITFGLGDENILGWNWKDSLTYITKTKPNQPVFHVSGYMSKIASLPYLMIQSSNDEFVPFDEARNLATLAREPKRVVVIPANNHRFDGNQNEFFRTLREGLQWMK
ncbi:MAG: alpha/beta hydrolase [Blastocatellales bacterium]